MKEKRKRGKYHRTTKRKRFIVTIKVVTEYVRMYIYILKQNQNCPISNKVQYIDPGNQRSK